MYRLKSVFLPLAASAAMLTGCARTSPPAAPPTPAAIYPSSPKIARKEKGEVPVFEIVKPKNGTAYQATYYPDRISFKPLSNHAESRNSFSRLANAPKKYISTYLDVTAYAHLYIINISFRFDEGKTPFSSRQSNFVTSNIMLHIYSSREMSQKQLLNFPFPPANIVVGQGRGQKPNEIIPVNLNEDRLPAGQTAIALWLDQAEFSRQSRAMGMPDAATKILNSLNQSSPGKIRTLNDFMRDIQTIMNARIAPGAKPMDKFVPLPSPLP